MSETNTSPASVNPSEAPTEQLNSVEDQRVNELIGSDEYLSELSGLALEVSQVAKALDGLKQNYEPHPTDSSIVPSKEANISRLQDLMNIGAAREESLKQQDELLDYLIDFQDTSTLGEEDTEAIISKLIDLTEGALEPTDSIPEQSAPDLEVDQENRKNHAQTLSLIDSVDRLRGYERVRQLGILADRLNKVNYGFGDLGVEAALRIRRSKTKGPLGRLLSRRGNYADFYLNQLAETGNLDAAMAMSRGVHVRDKSIYKSRNDALLTVSQMAEASPSSVTGLAGRDSQDILNLTKGLRGAGTRYEGISVLAERRGDPALISSVNGLINLYKKQDIKSRVAIAMAQRGGKDNIAQARQIAMTIKWPGQRNKALRIIADRESIPLPKKPNS